MKYKFLLFSMLLAINLQVIEAETLIVTTEADSGPGSLRDRVNEADPGDKIKFDPSVEFIRLFSEIVIDKDLRIHGNDVTLSGNNTNRIFLITNFDSNVFLKGLNFIDGNETLGGAIRNFGVLTIKKSSFEDNFSLAIGGAIYNQYALRIKRTDFIHNETSGAIGSNGGAIYNTGTANIKKSKFFENFALFGGALLNSLNATLNIKKTLFEENEATFGGAIYNIGFSRLEKVSFVQNSTLSEGGALYNVGLAGIDNSKFEENRAPLGIGGAIRNVALLNISDTKFEENTAQNGGAISNALTLTVEDSLFLRNIATNGTGGAVFNTATFNDIDNVYIDNVPSNFSP